MLQNSPPINDRATALLADAARAVAGEAAFARTLSIVIRFHEAGRSDLLADALASLAAQDWDDLELLLALQNPTPDVEGLVARLVSSQKWRRPPVVQILPMHVPPNVDGRSRLLNRAVEACRGRYLAFLDYDDIVRPSGYSSLIRQLQTGGKTWAVGGCLKTMSQRVGNVWQVAEKHKMSAHRSVDPLWSANFIPIHSYVIDRTRLGSVAVTFDENLTRLEDYDFLLRLAAEHAPDMSLIDTVICEYRIRLDGSNTTLDGQAAPSPAATAEWDRCQAIVEQRKVELKCSITAAELAEDSPLRASQQARIDQQGHAVEELTRNIHDLTRQSSGQARHISEQARHILEQTRYVSSQAGYIGELVRRMKDQQQVVEAHVAFAAWQEEQLKATASLLEMHVLQQSTRSYRLYIRLTGLAGRIPAPVRRVLFRAAFWAWQAGKAVKRLCSRLRPNPHVRSAVEI